MSRTRPSPAPRAARGAWIHAALCLLLAGAGCVRVPSGAEGGQEEARASRPDTIPAVAAREPAPRETPREDQLLAALGGAFREKNPRLRRVRVLDLRAPDFFGPRLVLGWAIVEDLTFRGDFNDEMFGVFVVDETLTRVDRVVDTFRTPRWFDFELRFGRVTADSVEIVGRGATYGDEAIRRVYKWR